MIRENGRLLRYLGLSLAVIVLLVVGIRTLVSSQAVTADTGNRLVNGDFEEEDPDTHGFKWYYPNHFVALHWERWWMANSVIPEYDDMRPGGRWPPYSGEHAQVYFKFGDTYHAGLFQVVDNLDPCRPYEFTMYTRNEGKKDYTHPHARIGLDPEGSRFTVDPHPHTYGLPPKTVWSQEQTELFKWEQLRVTTESLGSKLTAILYAAPIYFGDPKIVPYFDTFWDAGELQAVSFPGDKLPAPNSWNSPYIPAASVNTQLNGSQLTVNWNTTVAASGQVWYTRVPYTEPITTTTPYSNTIYFPLISRSPVPELATAIDYAPTTSHSAVISGLNSQDEVYIWVLSRRADTNACVTEGHGPLHVTVP
ncbi:MAG: hypothetical protein ACLFU8_08680 [Anaerolineales bacterium]